MYDIAIIGAGPSGSTLARLLAGRYKILLVEKRDLLRLEGPHEKCCGGLISEAAQKTLARMHLAVPKEVLVGPQIFTVRTIDTFTKKDNYYPKHYINIDRDKFDSWLLSLVPPSVKRQNAVFKSFREKDDFVELSLFDGSEVITEKCRFLVGADGASSMVRKILTNKKPLPQYIAIQEWFDCPNPQPFFSAIFDKEITDFYSWTIPKDGKLILGAALQTGKEAHAKFELLKNKLIPYGFDFSKPVKRNGALISRPLSLSNIFYGKSRVLLAGEAAGWISPSSAEGFSFAFKSAYALAEALDSKNCIKKYKSLCSPLKKNIFMKNLKSPVMFNSFLRNLAIRSGIQSLKMY